MGKTVSIVLVNYNGKNYLTPCIDSLKKMERTGYEIEIIVVDNVSSDGSVMFLRQEYPDITVIENPVNNYVQAINAGIKAANGEFIATLNNDVVVDKKWLLSLLETIKSDEKIGVVQSKILFLDGRRINSLGVEEVEDFYFRDIGFGEEVSTTFSGITGLFSPRQNILDFFSGCSVLFRKTCLDQVGTFDENFVMYMEDIDYSIRCRDQGWKIVLSHKSIVFHKYHGAASSGTCDYYCSRNRFLLIAKKYPEKLAKSVKTSHFYKNGDFKNLYHSLLQAAAMLLDHHDPTALKAVLEDLKEELTGIFGKQKALAFFSQVELIMGMRKIRVGIYDHAFHFAGGGQKYAAQIAEMFQDRYEITYIVNKPCDFLSYKEWFDIDLSRCRLKVIPIPFFEDRNRFFIDEGMVICEEVNPFDIISEESSNYDLFINANMLSKVEPRSEVSVFICHFPDRDREKFFQVDKYDYIITNSRYPSFWLHKRWGLKSSMILYPAVNLDCKHGEFPAKENIILSVSRFETGGSKKQLEMIRLFRSICISDPEAGTTWKLIIAGGTVDENPYFDQVVREVADYELGTIMVMPNLSHSELKLLYQKASIFWHACGLGETNPHLIEHFGMTTVEAMQNYCVPVVIDAGGQQEIVDHGINGFRFKTLEELKAFSLEVMNNDILRHELARNAFEKSKMYSPQIFRERVTSFMNEIETRLVGGEPLEVREQ